MTPYADITYANNYFNERLHTTYWDNANTQERNKALLMATRAIDRLEYYDDPVSDDNAFPRGTGTEVPSDIKIACCEEALALLSGIEPEKELRAAGILSDNLTGARTTYDRASVPDHIFALIASSVAWSYLKQYLKDSKAVILRRVS